MSVSIEINGKKYCVNKKSFAKHLTSIGLNAVADQYQKSIRSNPARIQQALGDETLGDNLTAKKRTLLLKKLALAILAGSTEKAWRLIQKGAYLNHKIGLISDPIYSGTVYLDSKHVRWHDSLAFVKYKNDYVSYSPLALALEKGNTKLARLIYKANKQNCELDAKEEFMILRWSNRNAAKWTETKRQVVRTREHGLQLQNPVQHTVNLLE